MAIIDTATARVIVQAFPHPDLNSFPTGEFSCGGLDFIQAIEAESSVFGGVPSNGIYARLMAFIRSHTQSLSPSDSRFGCTISISGLGVVWSRSVKPSEVESVLFNALTYGFRCDTSTDYTSRSFVSA